MAKQSNANQGECSICGLPGMRGMHCDDPLCGGMVEGIQEAPAKPVETANDRYEEGLIDDDPGVVSLESLAEEETEEP